MESFLFNNRDFRPLLRGSSSFCPGLSLRVLVCPDLSWCILISDDHGWSWYSMDSNGIQLPGKQFEPSTNSSPDLISDRGGNLLSSVPFLMAGHFSIKIFQTLGTPFFNTNPYNGCPKMICQYSGRAPRHFICYFHHISCLTDVRP